jgi:hypothetical protein
MPDIEMPDPEELGGLVTKPFNFVTGSYLDKPDINLIELTLSYSWYAVSHAIALRRFHCAVSASFILALIPSQLPATSTDLDSHRRLRCPLPQPEPVCLTPALLCRVRPLTSYTGQSTAGKITSTTTNASLPKERISDPADRYEY